MKTNNKRRDFIKKSALATGAGMIAPSFTFGTTHSKNMMRETVGHGNFKYTVDKEWGVQDPAKIPVNDCHEMVLDSKGRILMTIPGADNDNVIIDDRSGKVLDSWCT